MIEEEKGKYYDDTGYPVRHFYKDRKPRKDDEPPKVWEPRKVRAACCLECGGRYPYEKYAKTFGLCPHCRNYKKARHEFRRRIPEDLRGHEGKETTYEQTQKPCDYQPLPELTPDEKKALGIVNSQAWGRADGFGFERVPLRPTAKTGKDLDHELKTEDRGRGVSGRKFDRLLFQRRKEFPFTLLDLQQAGWEGYLKGIKTHDPQKGELWPRVQTLVRNSIIKQSLEMWPGTPKKEDKHEEWPFGFGYDTTGPPCTDQQIVSPHTT